MNDYKEIEWNDYDNLPSKKGKYKVIYYYPNGNIESERYKINNNYHREDGPAITSYFENRNVESKRYFINDKSHREDGPSYIWYYKKWKYFK